MANRRRIKSEAFAGLNQWPAKARPELHLYSGQRKNPFGLNQWPNGFDSLRGSS